MELKIEQQSLSEIAYNKIKELILNNVLKPGTKIKQEEMAKQLGISKIPLRQSLSVLESEGLVQTYHNRGFYVRHITKEELSEVLEVRTALETMSVFLIINVLNDGIKDKLLRFIMEFEDVYNKKDYKRYFDIDKKFHHYLIKASNNRILLKLNDISHVQVSRYLVGFELDMETSFKHHKELIEYILSKKQKEAAEVIRKHFLCVRDYFFNDENKKYSG